MFSLDNYSEKYIIGIDEVGMGALAGPLTVAAVKAPKEWAMEGLTDSKKIAKSKHKKFAYAISDLKEQGVLDFAIVNASHQTIDRLGISEAQRNLFVEALSKLDLTDSIIIIDGQVHDPRIKAISLPKADSLVQAVSAASIIAKYHRDTWMKGYHDAYPEYGWDTNAGYSSPKHLAALKSLGHSPLHRGSYEPIKSMILAGQRQSS